MKRRIAAFRAFATSLHSLASSWTRKALRHGPLRPRRRALPVAPVLLVVIAGRFLNLAADLLIGAGPDADRHAKLLIHLAGRVTLRRLFTQCALHAIRSLDEAPRPILPQIARESYRENQI